MDFNQRKRLIEYKINDHAKLMKGRLAPFAECSAKSDMITLIEDTRKEQLRALNDLTNL